MEIGKWRLDTEFRTGSGVWKSRWDMEIENRDWTWNSEKISSGSRIAEYRTRGSDLVFLDFRDDAQDTDP